MTSLLACAPDRAQGDDPGTDPVGETNHPPVIDVLAWGADAVATDDLLPVRARASDPDGDPVTVLLAWTVNGEPVPEEGDVLDGREHFEKGDVVDITVWPRDGEGFGPPAQLPGMVVLNTPPTAPVIAVGPDDPISGMHELACEVITDAEDADGDGISYTYGWEVAGQPIYEGATLPADLTGQAESWTCRVVAHDGQDEGEPAMLDIAVRSAEVDDLDPWVQPAVYVTPVEALPGDEVTVHYSGALADHEQVTLRYGWNGWIELVEGLTSEVDDNGSTIWSAELEMVPGDAGHTASLVLPDDARALHMTFHVDGELDDKDGLEYHHGIVFPYIGPYLTWNEQVQPDHGVVINFETSAPSYGVVSVSCGGEAARLVAGDTWGTLHRVFLADIEPDTTCSYRVLSSSGRTSDVFSFRTAPSEIDSFEFVVFADAQDDGASTDRWPEVAAAIAEEQGGAAFSLVPGDLAAEDSPGYWWRFFDGGRGLFEGMPMIPAIGNHDTPGKGSNSDFTSFTYYFELPGAGAGEAWYAQDYGPARFFLLASESPEDFEEDGVQREWLDEQLQATWDGDAREREWVFAAWHHPPYDVGDRFAAVQSDYRVLTDLLDGQVDWVFTGHEHLYQRFAPVRFEASLAANYGIGPEDGVGYIVVPTAGDRMWPNLVDPESDDADARDLASFPVLEADTIDVETEHGFVTVAIEGQSITIESWGMGDSGEPLDPWVQDSVSYTR